MLTENTDVPRQEDIMDLITDYVTKEITPADKARLQEWVDASPDNAQRLLTYTEIWLAMHGDHYDARAALRRFRQNIHKIERRHASMQRARRRRLIHRAHLWAAFVLMPIMLVASLYFYLQEKNVLAKPIEYTTLAGQQTTFLLPDGTAVRMEENSRLSYSARDFASGDRKVKFDGAAHFQVTADSLHPFDITTPHDRVHVLGTEFDLISRADGSYGMIVLDKGVVEHTNLDTNEEMHLTAGDVLTINNETNQEFRRTRTHCEMRWCPPHDVQDMHVQRYLAEDSVRMLLVNVDCTLDAGVYEMRVNEARDTVHFQRVGQQKTFQTGDGTRERPYIITTAQHLLNMRNALVPRQMTYFRLAADIDMFGIDWEPVNDRPNAQDYWIDFDGQYHTIRNLACTESSGRSSFFGVLCGECRNVGILNAVVAGSDSEAGVVAGRLGHPSYPGMSVVRDCYFTGHVTSKGYAGGLVGSVDGSAIISCVSTSVDAASQTLSSGGIAANVLGDLRIEHCYTGGNITGATASGALMKSATRPSASVSIDGLVVGCKSVCGNKNAYAVGNLQTSDTMHDMHQVDFLSLNGRRIPNGESYPDLVQFLESWPEVWFKRNVSPLY